MRCFRISIQKEGGVSGFSKLSSVRQTRAEPLRADSSSAVGIGAGAQGDDQLIAGRLKQFCDLGVGQCGLQFRRRQRQCRGIQCHLYYLVLL